MPLRKHIIIMFHSDFMTVYYLLTTLQQLFASSFGKNKLTSLSKVADMFHRSSVLIETTDRDKWSLTSMN